MKKRFMKKIMLLLACVLLLSACAPAQTGEKGDTVQPEQSGAQTAQDTKTPSQPEPTATESGHASEPGTESEESTETAQVPVNGEPAVVRVTGVNDVEKRLQSSAFDNWRSAGSSEKGETDLYHLTDTAEWEAFLTAAGIERLTQMSETYGEDFFTAYDLLIVPRSTSTGSITYSFRTDLTENGTYCVVITAKSPEYVTADMAEWFLLIPAEKSEVSGKRCIARLDGGRSVLDLNPKS